MESRKVVRLIYKINTELIAKRNRKGDLKSDLSGFVECTGLTPNRLEEDLARIATIKELPMETENRQEPRQKADYQLLKSYKKNKSKHGGRPKL